MASGCVEHENEVKLYYVFIWKDDLNKTLKVLLEVENVDVEVTKNKEYATCEEHFARTHSRTEKSR